MSERTLLSAPRGIGSVPEPAGTNKPILPTKTLGSSDGDRLGSPFAIQLGPTHVPLLVHRQKESPSENVTHTKKVGPRG